MSRYPALLFNLTCQRRLTAIQRKYDKVSIEPTTGGKKSNMKLKYVDSALDAAVTKSRKRESQTMDPESRERDHYEQTISTLSRKLDSLKVMNRGENLKMLKENITLLRYDIFKFHMVR